MNVYSLFPLLSFLSTLALGMYLLLINRSDKRNLLFFGVCSFLALWSLSHYMMFTATVLSDALWWDRLATVGSVFQGAFLLHFVLVFTKNRFQKSVVVLSALYASAFVFSAIDIFTKAFTGAISMQYWGFSSENGSWYLALAIYVVVVGVSSFLISLTSFLSENKGSEKAQLGLLAFGISIPLVGGIATQLIGPAFGVIMFPLTSTLTAVMAIIIAFSISRFRMFKSNLFSIRKKLLVSFFIISLLSAVLGHAALTSSEDALYEEIGKSSVILADETLHKINRVINEQIEHWSFVSHSCLLLSKSLTQSNAEFDAMGNTSDFISQMDEKWTSNDSNASVFVEEILANNLSKLFDSYEEFYDENSSNNLIALIYATNKYGAIVAQTSKASDYDQSDEQWFIDTAVNGTYASDVQVDESTGEKNTVAICIRVDNEAGQMLGVLKVIFNVEPLFEILQSLSDSESHSMSFSLLTSEGNIIYSIHEYSFFDPFPARIFSQLDSDDSSRYFLTENGSGAHCGEVLVAYAFSSGYGQFDGNNWILVFEQHTDVVFAPINELMVIILIVTAFIVMCSLVFGFWFSKSFSRPILLLNDAALRMSKGNLDEKIDVSTDDEIGQLADSFEEMRKNLSKLRDDLELRVRQRTADLNSKVEELEKFKSVTVNRELRMLELKEELDRLKEKVDDDSSNE